MHFALEYEYSLFLGDFNTNLLEPSRKTTRLSSVLSTFNMSCLGNQPTFYHMNGSSQLDLMFFSDESKVLRFNQFDAPVFSKHDLIFASFDFDVDHNISPYSFRDYNSINEDGLLEHFNNLDWLNFYRNSDPDQLLEFFNNEMIILHNEFVPTRTYNSPKKSNPWFNSSISKAIVDRDLAFKMWKASKLDIDHCLFKRLRNKASRMIHEAKKNYYALHLDNKLPSQELWKRLKSLGIGRSVPCPIQGYNADEINTNIAQNFLLSKQFD